jgi:hypothetical protein
MVVLPVACSTSSCNPPTTVAEEAVGFLFLGSGKGGHGRILPQAVSVWLGLG